MKEQIGTPQGVEKVDKQYGYTYIQNDDGTISITHKEIYKMLDQKPIMIDGRYPSYDYDGEEEYVNCELETLLENVCIGKVDMLGQRWRVSADKIVEQIYDIYKKNGWCEYSYTKYNRKEKN